MRTKLIFTLSKYTWSLLLTFWSCGMVLALQAQPQQIVNLSSPYHTITAHLKYLQDDNFRPDLAAQVFPEKGFSSQQREKFAIKLKHVLDGKGLFIDPALLPKDVNYTDSLTHLGRYYLAPSVFPELYVEKVGSKWLYSGTTTVMIEKWHKAVFPFGTDKLLELIPRRGYSKYLGLYLWQYIGLFIIVLLSFFLHRLFSFIAEKILTGVLLRMGYKSLAQRMLIPLARPVSILIIFPILIILVPVLQLPIKVNAFIITGLQVAWPVFAVIFFYRLVDIISLYLEKLAKKSESTLDDQLVPLLRKTLKTFVVIIGSLVVLENLDVNITGIIAGLSIGGLAFALAAQDTIKNFFGSLMIFFDKPFQVGDWITSGDVDGTVEEVGFRATRIRTFRNSVMYIPNGVITNTMIDNHGLRVYRRFYTKLSVTYDTPPHLIEAFTDGLKEIVNKHPGTRKDYYEVHLNDFAASSLDIMFYIFFQAPTWTDELKGRHEIMLLILKLAEELGVHFAFPTQTLHVDTLPEGKYNRPDYMKNNPEVKQRIEAFLNREFPGVKKAE